MAELQAELKAAGLAINLLHLQRLLGLGVKMKTAANLHCRGQAAWGAIRAEAGENGLYLPGKGEPHLVLPVVMDGELIDLVAFRSSNPADWMLRTGLGWSLGMDRGLEPYTWGTPPTLHETPLDWLRADCQGLVILDWSAPEIHSLKGLEEIVCATPGLAATLTRHLTRPQYLPKIVTVPQGTERKAA